MALGIGRDGTFTNVNGAFILVEKNLTSATTKCFAVYSRKYHVASRIYGSPTMTPSISAGSLPVLSQK